jgi:hypothetical protein
MVQAATAYDDPETSITYMLVINQALQIPNLEVTLLNSSQMHMNGVIMDNIPKHLAPNPETASHSTIFIRTADLRIPLQLKGVISGFKTRYPSLYEVKNCPWIELTISEPWDPKSEVFEEQEKNFEKQALQSNLMPDRSIYAIKTNNIIQQYYTIKDIMLNEMKKMVKISAISRSKNGTELRDKIARTFNVGLETAYYFTCSPLLNITPSF